MQTAWRVRYPTAGIGWKVSPHEAARRVLTLVCSAGMLVKCPWGLAGNIDQALKHLESAVDKGWGHKDWLENDTDLDPLRDSPRFKAIAEAM